MIYVEQAAIRPHRCAVVPYIGNSNTEEGFIDTGNDCPGNCGNHIYVSLRAIKELARMIGYVDKRSPDRLISHLKDQIVEKDQRIAELEEKQEAIDVLIGAKA